MNTLQIYRVSPPHEDLSELIRQLDADLAEKDGEDHAFYNQYNQLDGIQHVILAYQNGAAVACGAFKPFDEATVEIKRMFTVPAARGQGIAAKVLAALEGWAKEEGYSKARLETGKKMVAAIQLYTRGGYRSIPNYGPYMEVEDSVCFEKGLND